MKRFIFTVSLLLSSVLHAEAQETVFVPSSEWNQMIEKLKNCKVADVDLDETPTTYGFQCEDWMIYADTDIVSEISIVEIEGIIYLPDNQR